MTLRSDRSSGLDPGWELIELVRVVNGWTREKGNKMTKDVNGLTGQFEKEKGFFWPPGAYALQNLLSMGIWQNDAATRNRIGGGQPSGKIKKKFPEFASSRTPFPALGFNLSRVHRGNPKEQTAMGKNREFVFVTLWKRYEQSNAFFFLICRRWGDANGAQFPGQIIYSGKHSFASMLRAKASPMRQSASIPKLFICVSIF